MKNIMPEIASCKNLKLTLKDPFISESCIEIKVEAPQRSVKIKI